jgi:hypothetical protein
VLLPGGAFFPRQSRRRMSGYSRNDDANGQRPAH